MRCDVLELRQYSLHPGRRDELIELFDREFVESQEAHGMDVIGQFRDVERPDRFVWLRGYDDMATRGDALAGFYTGAVWAAHGAAANSTMVDFDDVLLLRPTASGAFAEIPKRAPVGAVGDGPGLVTATIHPLETGTSSDADACFTEWAASAREGVDARVVASFVTDPRENNFPTLPVREGDTVLVWFTTQPSGVAADLDRVARQVGDALGRLQAGEPETLRLVPTARSRLNGVA
ncbi:MAG: NIPSNAP family protein [Acidimicrobiales bacterium]|nr:NIPSNAP family protein [Acidimicrobiales bacterium]